MRLLSSLYGFYPFNIKICLIMQKVDNDSTNLHRQVIKWLRKKEDQKRERII